MAVIGTEVERRYSPSVDRQQSLHTGFEAMLAPTAAPTAQYQHQWTEVNRRYAQASIYSRSAGPAE